MKKFKSFFAILCCLSLLIALSATAFAGESPNIDEQLIAKGFPQYVLTKINDGAKQDALLSGGEFDIATIQHFDKDMNLILQTDVSNGKEPAVPRGTISASSLTFSLVSMNLSSGEKRLLASYDWKRLPINRWVDELAIQWDTNHWYAKAGAFYQTSRYDAYHNNGTLVEGIAINENSNPMKSSTVGVIWDANLKASTSTYQVVGLYGFGAITVVSRSSSASSIHATYLHKKISITGVSLGFGVVSPLISGLSSGYDSVSTYINV